MDDRLLFLLSRSQHVLKNYLKKEFSRAGVDISPAQMGILFLLKLKDGRKMSEFSTALFIDNSAITGLVDRMEKAGLLERRSNPDDRRQNMIFITTKGLEEGNRAKRLSNRINEEIKSGFSNEEIEVFKRMLNSFFDKFSGD